MKEPELPDDEDRRLFALHALQVLDTPPEERFDRITRLAIRALDVPIALISLVDRNRQWFKSAQGVELRETSRQISFCAHALQGDTALVVEDALLDPRFQNNPLVVGEPHIRFYAGHPLVAEDGLALGTLCVIDHAPRRLRPEDLAVLRDLAALAQNELQIVDLTRLGLSIVKNRDHFQRRALIDPLTEVWSRGGIGEILTQELARAKRAQHETAVAFVDLDGFKQVNDEHGHAAGDAVLRESAVRLREALRLYDSLGRWGGDEFLVVLPNCTLAAAEQVAQRMLARLCAEPVRIFEGTVTLGASLGIASSGTGASVEALVQSANTAMHRAKHLGRGRVECARPEAS